ncbi:MAG: hypothetical protein RBT51_15230 [Ectothiorhodospiraceae bacterium]|jgi:hypothetical protein|nr:hypothetical protein [Ectothiorhodospiraceae bacterium]
MAWRFILALALGALAPAQAGEWVFDAPRDVAGAARTGVFTQLDGAGRRHLAVSGDVLAVVWSDRRAGSYQAWAAFGAGDSDFTAPMRLSTGNEAYAPTVAALGDGRFLFAWEQDGRVWARSGDAQGLGPARMLDDAPSEQPSVAAGGGGAAIAWARREGRFLRLYFSRLQSGDDGWRATDVQPVDREPARDDQLYPSLVSVGDGYVIGWEDRRHGHTRLFTARWQGDGFTAPRPLNEVPPSASATFGRGTGVTRVVLDACGDRVAAVWMDKRDFRSGYDVYAAVSEDGGASFGRNEKVQDVFGDGAPQWRPAVAISPAGTVLAAWDDNRDERSDLWLSLRDADGAWSDDFSPPGAHGPEAQTAPAIAFDDDGRLHLLWVERNANGATALRHLRGRNP